VFLFISKHRMTSSSRFSSWQYYSHDSHSTIS